MFDTYERKPEEVQAVKLTKENFYDILEYMQGTECWSSVTHWNIHYAESLEDKTFGSISFRNALGYSDVLRIGNWLVKDKVKGFISLYDNEFVKKYIRS